MTMTRAETIHQSAAAISAHVLTLVRGFERGESATWADRYVAESVPDDLRAIVMDCTIKAIHDRSHGLRTHTWDRTTAHD